MVQSILSPILIALIAVSVVAARDALGGDTSNEGMVQGETKTFHSKHLGGGIVVPPGVFAPIEAETTVLPFMKANRKIFAGKRVLEIGAGSGINSVYAAKLGAVHVIATDISPLALRTVRLNAKRFGVESVVETRLVPESNTTAYSVMKPGELVDVVLSNPPYALDLDAEKSDAVTDPGDLGISIVRGIPEHVEAKGIVVLFYNSLFYHHLMAKFARLSGYEVRNHIPRTIQSWETETLFNSYAERWARAMELDPNDFRFDRNVDPGLDSIQTSSSRPQPPLFPWNGPSQRSDGWILIRRR